MTPLGAGAVEMRFRFLAPRFGGVVKPRVLLCDVVFNLFEWQIQIQKQKSI